MKIKISPSLLTLAFVGITLNANARQWTLQECINYALSNNISIKKAQINTLSVHEDVLQSKAALLPSIDASTSQNIGYTPFQENSRASVANGYVENSIDKVYYNGNYGVNLNWTIWNGNRNKNLIKLNELTEQQAQADSAIQANSIQEQITQLYIQILYTKEALTVCQQSLATSKKNEQRALTMQQVGSISKADAAQLTAQRANDEYNLTATESNLRNYKRQLKQLLEITTDDEFDVATPETTDTPLQPIPSIVNVYEQALQTRPEIAQQRLAIDASQVNIDIARAQKLPTIGVSAGVSTNTSSLSQNAWGTQLKNNFSVGAGVTVSIPIFDGRQSKTAINKANLARENNILQLQNLQTQLHSTIESYWIQAYNNQAKYQAAKANTQSQMTSYEMLSEQFQQGLKNIVELMTGKTNLLQAQQSELESKYLTLYNIQMLKFYQNGTLRQ